jgi:hypothetical protein
MAKTANSSYKLKNWLGVCITCGKDKTTAKFGRGRAGECNYCYKTRWNANNALKVRAQRLYGNAQKRAKEQGWPPPDFSSLWIEAKILDGVCQVTGISFDLHSQVADTVHAKNPWVPSIDRIDSSKPYSKDNIQVVVYMYNVCKAEFAHKDVVKFCRAVAAMEAEIG